MSGKCFHRKVLNLIKSEIRVATLGLLLGIDNNIFPSLDLEIGKGIWREEGNTNWNKWN
ncbi:MAG: hypothetical protein RLZZ546_2320 [Bacteroidota bacterium]